MGTEGPASAWRHSSSGARPTLGQSFQPRTKFWPQHTQGLPVRLTTPEIYGCLAPGFGSESTLGVLKDMGHQASKPRATRRSGKRQHKKYPGHRRISQGSLRDQTDWPRGSQVFSEESLNTEISVQTKVKMEPPAENTRAHPGSQQHGQEGSVAQDLLSVSSGLAPLCEEMRRRECPALQKHTVAR